MSRTSPSLALLGLVNPKIKSIKSPRPLSKLEETFALHCRVAKLPPFVREFQFDPTRKWRSDFAWPEKMILVEIEGGVWGKGRHTTGVGFIADCEKYNAAARLGYFVFRFAENSVMNNAAATLIKQVLSQ